MLGWILLGIGIAGFGLAGWLDLKTTEFPDWIPYFIIVSALLVRGVFAWLGQDWSIITESILVGLAFLAFGLALYFLKQWGDGDAWLLGSLGFLFPSQTGFQAAATVQFSFPLAMLFNFFFIAFIYLLVYSLILGLRTQDVSRKFSHELKKDSKGIASLMTAFCTVYAVFIIYIYLAYSVLVFTLLQTVLFPVVLLAIIIFVRYGRFIEGVTFKKRIDVKDLRIGDVPIGGKWRVLTEKEVRALKEKGGKIWIKEGVRFAPVFLITMLVTLFYGNLILLLI